MSTKEIMAFIEWVGATLEQTLDPSIRAALIEMTKAEVVRWLSYKSGDC